MTKTYDFSVFDIREHNYAFATMTPEQIEEKKKLLEEQQKSKLAATSNTPPPSPTTLSDTTKPARPVFKPKIKPPGL
jgi:NADH-quinone oxidoreductase subunit I